MLRRLLFTTLLSITIGGCADPSPGADGATCTGKCDGTGVSAQPPDEAVVRRLLADAGRDGTIDATEANALAAFVKAADGRNTRIVSLLQATVANDPRLTSDAAAVIQRAISGDRPGDVPLSNAVYKVVVGSSPFLEDDALYLVGDGVVEAQTGIRSHSRGYAAKRDGVLFQRHGSLAPHHDATDTWTDTSTLRNRTPDVELDLAAKTAGLALSQYTTFSATAHSPTYYDPSPSTPYWAGICQGWTHNALDNRLSVLVDPPGQEGARGLWIFGQWISRADLGNAMMGASLSLGIADSITIDSFVKPDKLVKALAQYVLRSGVGLRVDIWNDEHNQTGEYDPEIWNQPIVGARVEVSSVSAAVRDAIVGYAQAHTTGAAIPAGANVKLVRASASWGVEAGDSWERDPVFDASAWTMYMVTAPDGLVVRAMMAYDLVGVAGVPVTDSDGLPDYMAVPRHELTDAAFAGAPHRLLGTDNPDGARFRFLVGTVLARGIPDATRTAFEAEALAANVDPDALAARYPGIANAYSPEQWARVFAPRLGAGTKFGAVWPQ